jgi:hypothetical protein
MNFRLWRFLGPLAAQHAANKKTPAMAHSSGDDAKRSSIASDYASSGGVSSTPQKHSGADSKTSTSLTPLTAQYHKFAVKSQWY